MGRLRVAHCQPAWPKSVHRSSSYAVHATGPDIAPLPVLVRLLEENGLPEDMGQSSHVLLLDTFLHQAITGPVLPSGAFTSLFSLLASLPCSPLLGCGITHTHTHTHTLSLSLSLCLALSLACPMQTTWRRAAAAAESAHATAAARILPRETASSFSCRPGCSSCPSWALGVYWKVNLVKA